MHSKQYEREGITVHHNGDYSGDAIIVVHEGFGRQEGEIHVPCAVLLDFGGEAMRDKIISAIEDVQA
jgi:hypothetical protein